MCHYVTRRKQTRLQAGSSLSLWQTRYDAMCPREASIQVKSAAPARPPMGEVCSPEFQKIDIAHPGSPGNGDMARSRTPCGIIACSIRTIVQRGYGSRLLSGICIISAASSLLRESFYHTSPVIALQWNPVLTFGLMALTFMV
jgi:hypothetical protein